jgi:hypothetical protein
MQSWRGGVPGLKDRVLLARSEGWILSQAVLLDGMRVGCGGNDAVACAGVRRLIGSPWHGRWRWCGRQAGALVLVEGYAHLGVADRSDALNGNPVDATPNKYFNCGTCTHRIPLSLPCDDGGLKVGTFSERCNSPPSEDGGVGAPVMLVDR